MSKLDKILEQFSDYGHHDNNGYGDCPTCKKVAEAKQAIQQELLKARIETLEWLLEQEVEFGGLELKQSIIDKVADLQKELFKDLQAKLKENSDG